MSLVLEACGTLGIRASSSVGVTVKCDTSKMREAAKTTRGTLERAIRNRESAIERFVLDLAHALGVTPDMENPVPLGERVLQAARALRTETDLLRKERDTINEALKEEMASSVELEAAVRVRREFVSAEELAASRNEKPVGDDIFWSSPIYDED